MMHQIPVILSKLTAPEISPDPVARPRLIELLTQAVQASLTLVTAPAGYGKTSLLEQFSHQAEYPIAWYRLDSKDNNPERFLAHLATAFRQAEVISDASLNCCLDAMTSDFDQAWALLLNQLQQKKSPFGLVLDNGGNIKSDKLRQLTQQLVQLAPSQCHIFIAGRRKPGLALTRYLAAGKLLEIETSDLTFTAGETQILLTQHEIKASASEIYRLNSRTEGWITGIQLWLTAWRKISAKDQATLEAPGVTSLAYRYIADYFKEEVLHPLSRPVQHFLQNTCIVNSIIEPLAMELSGQPKTHQLIQRLLKDNLFIQAKERPEGCYRYHPLFQQTLYHQSKTSRPEQTTELHRKAAEWLLRQGHYAEGIQQYGLCHDLSSLLAVIEKHTFDLLREGEVNEIVSFLANVPDALSADHLTLAVTEASVVIVSNDVIRAKTCINHLQKIITQLPPRTDSTRIRQTINFIRSRLAYLGGNLAHGIRICNQAFKPQSKTNAALSVIRFNRASCYFSLGQLHNAERDAQQAHRELQKFGLTGFTNSLSFLLGQIELAQGHISQAEQRYRQLQPHNNNETAPHNFYDIFSNLGLGIVHIEKNQLTTAGHYLNQAADIALKFQPSAALPWVFFYIGMLHCAEDDLDHAADVWDEALRIASSHKLYNIYRLCNAYRTRLAIRRNEPEICRQWLNQSDRWLSLDDESTLPEERLTYGWLQRQQGNWDEASHCCDRLIDELQQQNNTLLLIDTLLLQASLHHDEGHTELAIEALNKGLELSIGSGSARLFLFEGQALNDLFRLGLSGKALLEQGLTTTLIHPDFVEQQLLSLSKKQSGSNLPRSIQLPFEQITKREMEVLLLITQGQSNQEIADSLFVGISTVKTHINNIFKKLDVSSRKHAIEKTQALQLLN
ncbi:LuxR C-terminal-related transcriptional regulator [Amphritea sp. HPY]|uniref:LuxR C-terminal-related transcriptional regulator n=1 Tax=Amphritea sp. HPY TaxID=3421652 RepID=UPI003D7E77D1